MPENFFLLDIKPIDQQIDEAYEDYLENFTGDEEPMSRSEYEERYY